MVAEPIIARAPGPRCGGPDGEYASIDGGGGDPESARPSAAKALRGPAGICSDTPSFGDVAQLGERGVRNAEVGSSILLVSTIPPLQGGGDQD